MVIGYVALSVGLVFGLWQLRSLSDRRVADRQEQSGEFCRAIPNAAAATAQALVDVLVADGVRRNVSDSDLAQTRRIGRLYVDRARLVALRDLPGCRAIIESVEQ